MRRVYGLPGSILEGVRPWLPAGAEARPWRGEGELPAVLLVAGSELPGATAPMLDLPGLAVVVVDDVEPAPDALQALRPFARLPRATAVDVARGVLEAALAQAALARSHAETVAEHDRLAQELRDLTLIGISLSAERDTDTLLELILTKAREITGSDAGSLYLVEADEAGRRRLRFKLVQNDSQAVPFKESTLAVGSESVAGYVALTGRPVSVDDAYRLPAEAGFRIDRTFDEQAGYRTKSMLAVPMRTPAGDVLGVLQLINRKADRRQRFASSAEIERDALAFEPGSVELGSFLASQAAVALANARLYADLRKALASLEESQRRVIQGERLRALGEMATGVAHDFNNVLAVVVGRAQLLLRQTLDPELVRQLDAIEQAGQEGAQTVRRIQEFARVRRSRPFQSVDLSRVVDEVVEAARPRWQDEARIRGVDYDVRVEGGPLSPVSGDPVELRESLLNIFLNALDAMPRGGRVTVSTEVRGSWAICAVADTGCGMTEAVRRRVFEPFFTTKVEQGTGLGLSIAYGIVTRHGGEIDVTSRPGAGSAFTIRLPLASVAPAGELEDLAGTSSRPARILVVEDQAPVGAVLGDLLTGMGHEVVACTDGRAALARLESSPFDLVVLDLGLPGVSGWDVVARVRQRRPGVPVILVTGWGHQLDLRETRQAGIDHVVAKPFNVDDLGATIATALARRASRPA
jgi:signal transduction histidine kinase/ActR/RegA family two-component response regulator